jgi:hypothetical protein
MRILPKKRFLRSCSKVNKRGEFLLAVKLTKEENFSMTVLSNIDVVYGVEQVLSRLFDVYVRMLKDMYYYERYPINC